MKIRKVTACFFGRISHIFSFLSIYWEAKGVDGMTEQERKKRREQLRREMGYTKRNRTIPQTENKKDFFLFRLYVTVILCGGILLLSAFQSQTAQMVTEKVKQAIAYQMPIERLQETKDNIMVFLEEHQVALPAFVPKETENVP